MNERGGAQFPSFYAAMETNISQEKHKDLSLSGQGISLFSSPGAPSLAVRINKIKKGTPLNPVVFDASF